MRVLFVNDYAAEVGGVEVYDRRLIDLLRERGHDIRFFGGEEAERYVHQFLRSIYSPQFRRKIGNVIAQFNPDVIFAHSICYNVSPAFLIEAERQGVPVVLTVPELSQLGYVFRNMPTHYVPFSALRKAIQRHFVKQYVDRFIVPSRTAEEHIRSGLGVDDVKFIRHPVFWDVASGPSALDSQRVLFVGRLESIKGVDVLIRAFDQVVDTHAESELTIVGDGPERNRLERLVQERDLCSHVRFEGKVSNEHVRSYYRRSSLFVLPTVVEENCPMTIIEALSQGTPIVTTDLGGQRELVKGEGCAWSVPPNDESALAEAIRELLGDHETLRDLSENGRQYAQSFSKDRHAEQIECLLNEVATPVSIPTTGS